AAAYFPLTVLIIVQSHQSFFGDVINKSDSDISYQPDIDSTSMKNYFREGIFLALFITLSGVASAQLYDSILKKLDSQFPQEKLYLQFDKSTYNPGETIWFKAYLLASNYPSDIRHTIYTELLDDKGNVIEKKSGPVFR